MTETTKSDLLGLADRVESGKTFHHNMSPSGVGIRTIHGALGLPFWEDAEFTKRIEPGEYLTSLDAAKALHDAVLPGWSVIRLGQIHLGAGVWHVELSNDALAPATATDEEWIGKWARANAQTPAAAWVAAILRAKAGAD